MRDTYWTVGPAGWGRYTWDPAERSLAPSEAQATRVLSPGFVDVHIHGHGGIDFMSATAADLVRMADILDALGYEAFLPTTITASCKDVVRAVQALPHDDPRIPGFHLEGPFISPVFPGAQPLDYILPPPAEESEWQAVLHHPQLRYITLAPELPGAIPLIRKLTAHGVRVTLGHTNATYAEALAARKAGATSLTHTFNAMRPLHHREPGMVGFALLHPEHYAELIYDRVHVSPVSAQLLAVETRENTLVAVSDGTAAAGLSPGQSLEMWGHRIEMREDRIVLAGTETLAGSAISLRDAFHRLWEDLGPAWAVRACCVNPRAMMGWLAPPRKWLLWSLDGELLDQIY